MKEGKSALEREGPRLGSACFQGTRVTHKLQNGAGRNPSLILLEGGVQLGVLQIHCSPCRGDMEVSS